MGAYPRTQHNTRLPRVSRWLPRPSHRQERLRVRCVPNVLCFHRLGFLREKFRMVVGRLLAGRLPWWLLVVRGWIGGRRVGNRGWFGNEDPALQNLHTPKPNRRSQIRHRNLPLTRLGNKQRELAWDMCHGRRKLWYYKRCGGLLLTNVLVANCTHVMAEASCDYVPLTSLDP